MPSTRLPMLLHQLDLAFDRRSWHGPNLSGSLRGVTLREAGWRPHPDRHNIWEEVVHCAYWKYRVCRRLAPDRFSSFPIKGSDWFYRPDERTVEAWQRDVELLREWHRHLCSCVANLDDARLDEQVGGSRFTLLELISGAVAHDVYHAGQIRLLRRMAGDAGI